ncbi:TIM12 (YBR091C) [Zygosaccharomyces parabailii]|nr:TIM12 (YBR091C) [Zygosaccharomyces parabailii]CDH08587.1 probable Mitochondrial import inner membrane translocase subunit TIM12 [Zygosaccharomyces bailii ISA1307]
MSYLLNPYASQEVSQDKLDVAEVQFDAMNHTFNNILNTCMEKCIPHEGYGESDLNKGEMCCIDRCVAKIHYSNRLIGAYVQTQGFEPVKYLPHYEKAKRDLESSN